MAGLAARPAFDFEGVMTEQAPIRWTRLDGTSVPIERLDLHELVAAHQQLLSGDWSAEDTRLLVAAIERELALRWRRPATAGKAHDPGETPRAA
jgi:hypothetical protein